MQKIALVLGASGQLGSEIKTVCDQYTDLTFYFAGRNEIDIQDIDLLSLIEYHRPSIVINCAAYTAVDQAEDDQANAFAINGDALINLSKAVKSCGATLIHVSSDYVYHNNKKGPLLENDDCLPQGIYAKSKWQGEENIKKELNQYIIVRTSWLYSTFGNNFVKTMLRLAKTKDELSIVSDQIGAPTYARDLAHVICQISTQVATNDNSESLYGIYNYANEGVTSWLDFATEIFNLTNKNVTVKPISTQDYNAPAARPLWSVMSKQKIKSKFNITIDHWRNALIRMLADLNQHQPLEKHKAS